MIDELRAGAEYNSQVHDLRKENKSLRMELDHSHHRAYSTVGLPNTKNNSALELLGNLSTLRSRSQHLHEAQSAFTHRSGFSNYSITVPQSDYSPARDEDKKKAHLANTLIRDLLEMVKGERNSSYKQLLSQRYSDLEELQRALQENAEEERGGGLLGTLALLIELIKKEDRRHESKESKDMSTEMQPGVSIATSPMKRS